MRKKDVNTDSLFLLSAIFELFNTKTKKKQKNRVSLLVKFPPKIQLFLHSISLFFSRDLQSYCINLFPVFVIFNFVLVSTSIFSILYAITVQKTLLVSILMEFWPFDHLFFQVSTSTLSLSVSLLWHSCIFFFIQFRPSFSCAKFLFFFCNNHLWVFVIFHFYQLYLCGFSLFFIFFNFIFVGFRVFLLKNQLFLFYTLILLKEPYLFPFQWNFEFLILFQVFAFYLI